MQVKLTRLTNDRHRFEVVRDDGTRESHEMETRSLLTHDLVHFAVESEAKLSTAFFGQLSSGRTVQEINDAPSMSPEAMQTERVVAVIQGASKQPHWPDMDAEQMAASLADAFRSVGDTPPSWLNGPFIARVRERLRKLQGQWRSTAFHQAMELRFPPDP